MTSEPGSFARHTIKERKPQVIRDVLTNSDRAGAISGPLADFQREIDSEPVAPPPAAVPLYPDWQDEWSKWQGRHWLEVPWYFAESYFYTRLLDAIGYYQGEHGDPFATSKAYLLEMAVNILPTLARAEKTAHGCVPEVAFRLLARRSLWGNRLDLSNVGVIERHRHDPSHLDDSAVVVDDCDRAWQVIQANLQRPVTFICDNSGPELIADLHLMDWLLTAAGVSNVVMEVKAQPFFVSDAMKTDVLAAIRLLARASEEPVRRIGERLQQALKEERLVIRTHSFWSGPYHYDRLPRDLKERLALSSLVIAKGDVNYRRFLRDLHWPFQTPIEKVIDFFPANALLLRTLKGELICGLNKQDVERLSRSGNHWLINGRHGVAQFVPATP